jgi:hypothetical protein
VKPTIETVTCCSLKCNHLNARLSILYTFLLRGQRYNHSMERQANASRLQGNQRVGNGMNCECDPIIDPNLAHQLGDVRFHRALLDA